MELTQSSEEESNYKILDFSKAKLPPKKLKQPKSKLELDSFQNNKLEYDSPSELT